MGATKRVGEMIVSAIARESETEFAIVRFGNVLGSRGSLVPTLQAQIEQGGPVRITHPEMQRYFMSINEAVHLILRAGAFSSQGDIYILDMGEPIRILDMARDLIRLYGLVPEQDIPIVFTGARPGEKLHEQLCYDEEVLEATANPKIKRVRLHTVPEWGWLQSQLETLLNLCEKEQAEAARTMLLELATGKLADLLGRRAGGEAELKLWSAVASATLISACAAQQIPSRDDPLYDYLARENPTPSTLLRTPRSADELLRTLPSDLHTPTQIARWKLRDAPSLPPQATILIVELQAFAFPNRSDWRTAEATYRVTGAWTINTQTLLEVVWSDARRRAGDNPSAFGTVPYATLTLQRGTVRGRVGYSTLRWLGGYSGGMLVNDETPPCAARRRSVPRAHPAAG
jgi:hypothetical protein